MRALYLILCICAISCEAWSSVSAKLDSIEKAVAEYLERLDANHLFYDIDTRNAAFFYYTRQIAPEFIDSIESHTADSLVQCLSNPSLTYGYHEIFSTDYDIIAADIFNLLNRQPINQFAKTTDRIKKLHAIKKLNDGVLEMFVSPSDYNYYPTCDITEAAYRRDPISHSCYYAPYNVTNDTVIISRGSNDANSVVRVYDCEIFGMPTRLYFSIIDSGGGYELIIRCKNSYSAIDNYTENIQANLSEHEWGIRNLKLSENISFDEFIRIFAKVIDLMSKDIDITRLSMIELKLSMLGDYTINATLNSCIDEINNYIKDSDLIKSIGTILDNHQIRIDSVNTSCLSHMKKVFFLSENLVSEKLKEASPDNLLDGIICIKTIHFEQQ